MSADGSTASNNSTRLQKNSVLTLASRYRALTGRFGSSNRTNAVQEAMRGSSANRNVLLAK
jgi:hypothetical protein